MTDLELTESNLLAIQRVIDKASHLYGRGIASEDLKHICRNTIENDGLCEDIVSCAVKEWHERNPRKEPDPYELAWWKERDQLKEQILFLKGELLDKINCDNDAVSENDGDAFTEIRRRMDESEKVELDKSVSETRANHKAAIEGEKE